MTLRFRPLGRSRQAELRSVDDLALVPTLPDALWVATAVPVVALRMDRGFLALLDADGDGRVRSDDLRAAIAWTLAVFADRSAIRAGNATLDPATLAAAGDGAAIREACRTLGASVTLDAVRKVRADAEAGGLSAAGRVLPAAAGDDAALRGFLERVVAVTGGEAHPSGAPAASEATLARYLAEAADWLAWSEAPAGDPTLLPLGDATDAALAAHDAVAAKLEQYFLLCDAVHLDPAIAARQWVEATNGDLLDPAAAGAVLAAAPLARPCAEGALDPARGLNPAWRVRIEAWRAAVAPLGLPAGPLDRAAVAQVAERLAPHRAWKARTPATTAGAAGADLARAHLADAALADRTRALLAQTAAASVALDGVKLVEKAILMQAWLLPFANTMVAMPDLFDPAVKGWAERGTLVIDGRVFSLALTVDDPARAERFAATSPLFTMFVRVGDKGGALDEELMVPVTAGEREHLVEGMWGVFFDVDGRERHAQIRKMIANPISIWEAIVAPFRKIGDAIRSTLDQASASQTEAMGGTVTARAAAAAGATANVASASVEAGTAAAAAPAPAQAPAPVAAPPPAAGSSLGSLPMLLAGVGIALGAIGAFLTQAFAMLFGATAAVSEAVAGYSGQLGLPETTQSAVAAASFPFALVLVVAGVALVPFLIYATPVALATWFRLRRRDLATLLEGSGWAINTRLYLDAPLAAQLTTRPRQP